MNQAEFEKLFRKYFTMMAKIAYHVVKDEDTANDIVQQVFIKLWEKRESINIQSSEKSYLHRAVVNTALNYLEQHKKTEAWSSSSATQIISNNDIEDGLHEENLSSAVHEALEKLPPVCRTVFSLSRFSDMSNKEIASYLNVSIKAVEKHISKALKHLRIHLKPFLSASGLALILFTVFRSMLEVGLYSLITVLLLTRLA